MYRDNGGGEPGGDIAHGTGENRSFALILSVLSLRSRDGLASLSSRGGQSHRTFLRLLVGLDRAKLLDGFGGDWGGLGGDRFDERKRGAYVVVGVSWGLAAFVGMGSLLRRGNSGDVGLEYIVIAWPYRGGVVDFVDDCFLIVLRKLG